MDVLDRISQSALIPVVVLDNSEDALPTANAAAAIRTVSERCPTMLVGAGTVLNLEQCRRAVELGARFLVSPGFDPAVVRWCVDRGVTIIPGWVTPSEIMSAIAMGLRVVKFFPANIYGGLEAMKALSAPFGGIRFIPTGGVGPRNVGSYCAAPFVHAVGGSWICSKADIAAGNFDIITTLCREARQAIDQARNEHQGGTQP